MHVKFVVSEAYFAEQSSFSDQGISWLLFWSGKAEEEWDLSGLGERVWKCHLCLCPHSTSQLQLQCPPGEMTITGFYWSSVQNMNWPLQICSSRKRESAANPVQQFSEVNDAQVKPTTKHQNWFDAETQELLEGKHTCNKHVLDSPNNQAGKDIYQKPAIPYNPIGAHSGMTGGLTLQKTFKVWLMQRTLACLWRKGMYTKPKSHWQKRYQTLLTNTIVYRLPPETWDVTWQRENPGRSLPARQMGPCLRGTLFCPSCDHTLSNKQSVWVQRIISLRKQW